MKHYLLSIMLDDQWIMHGYVMAKDKSKMEAVGHLMLDKAEATAAHVMMPVILQTELNDSPAAIKLVRDIAMENPEAKALMAKATDLHYTVWAMTKNNPQCKKLMELH